MTILRLPFFFSRIWDVALGSPWVPLGPWASLGFLGVPWSPWAPLGPLGPPEPLSYASLAWCNVAIISAVSIQYIL